MPPIAWIPKDWTVGDAFDRVESTLGWSALGCMRDASAIGLDAVRCSVLNDFLMGDTSQRSTIPMNDRISGQETSVSALLYCIFYATQQAVMLRDYEGKDTDFYLGLVYVELLDEPRLS